MNKKIKPNIAIGASVNILGYLCIALMATVAKLIPATIPATTILFFQNIICLLLVLPQVIKAGKNGLKTEHPWLHLTRDIAGVLSFLMLFIAVKNISLVNAVLLQNAAPLWIPFVVLIGLRKKVSSHLWFTIPIGFIGIIMILHPNAHMLENLGTVVGILSGIFLAISLVTIRRLKLIEPTYRILFYYFLVGTIMMLPFLFVNWVPLTNTDIALLISVGIFMYLGQMLITYSFHHAKASTLSPLSYSTIIFSVIAGWLIWGEAPSLLAALGIILVIIGGVLSVVMEKKELGATDISQ